MAPAEPLPAGSFSAWLRALRSARQEQRDVDVPCGECTACCRSSLFIHIAPEERETLARIDPALLFPAPGAPPGHVLMGYDRHGRCPQLSTSGCTIYEHRPRTCRDFDCRTVAATAIALDQAQHAIAEQARRWRFDPPAPEDEEQQAAVRAAGAFLVERGPDLLPEALPAHPLQLAMLALRVHEVFLALHGSTGDARPPDTELARAILAAMARHTADTGREPARATSVKRAPRTRS
jgi:Fe-S-cluster containining protein